MRALDREQQGARNANRNTSPPGTPINPVQPPGSSGYVCVDVDSIDLEPILLQMIESARLELPQGMNAAGYWSMNQERIEPVAPESHEHQLALDVAMACGAINPLGYVSIPNWLYTNERLTMDIWRKIEMRVLDEAVSELRRTPDQKSSALAIRAQRYLAWKAENHNLTPW